MKCGITSNIDGSDDNQVNIRGLEDYRMPLPEEERRQVRKDDSGEEEWITDKDVDNTSDESDG